MSRSTPVSLRGGKVDLNMSEPRKTSPESPQLKSKG